ncbi:MAG: hypothetical protein M3R72_04210 [Bacteroidota bacterium]|nr:hypothetical protein [Bacteroidota bacterium]
MKQFIAIAGIVLFSACGSNGGTTTPSDSASAAPHDTTNAVNIPLPDTSIIRKDSNHITGDKTDPRKDSLLR